MRLKKRVYELERTVNKISQENQMHARPDLPNVFEVVSWYPPVSLKTVVEQLLDHLGLVVSTTPCVIHLKRIKKKEDKK